MKKQFIFKILSVISGFLTIALLSSIAALAQLKVFPSSIHIFEQPELVENPFFILIMKLIAVLLCCIAGGFVSGKISDWSKSILWISALIGIIIAYIWFSTRQPFWFWLILMLGIYPAVKFGNNLSTKKVNARESL